jgi:hypothetical protein
MKVIVDEAYFESDAAHENDKQILMMAKFIEVSGETYRGDGEYERCGEWIPMDTVWNSLDPAAKRERLQQALGAWFGIQFIGKEQVFMATMNAYIAEK